MRVGLSAGALCVTAWLAGCAAPPPPDISADTWTGSAADFVLKDGGQRHSFRNFEAIVVAVRASRAEPVPSARAIQVNWYIYRGDTLISSQLKREIWDGAAKTFALKITPESLAPGSYTASLRIDSRVIATTALLVRATVVPRVAANFTLGPDCSGMPANQIRGIKALIVVMPRLAKERHKAGCAVTAVRLNPNGGVQGVSLVGVEPPGFGIGRAAAVASWNAIFPSGHGGATTYLRYRFNPGGQPRPTPEAVRINLPPI